MITLCLIGIGTGNPKHLTLQAIEAMNAADLILIPHKGDGKDDLAGLRHQICRDVLTDDTTKIAEFALPVRDPDIADYRIRVGAWHDAIALIWVDEIQARLGSSGRVAFLVWGDPSLYDSTLRIADRVERTMPMDLDVIPGITSIQALTAAHMVPLNRINAPVTITTGRQIRDHGFPDGDGTAVIMLDGECSFTKLNTKGLHIWWTAYAGMENEVSIAGPVADVTDKILRIRAAAREKHGWIMDIYMLQRHP